MDCTIAIEVPANLAAHVQALIEHVGAFTTAAAEATPPDFSAGESKLLEVMSELEGAALGHMLVALDPVAPRVQVGDVVYRRLNQDARCTYCTLRAEVVINRHLYRQEGVRNGPTIVPLDLRAGIVDSRYTPAAAVAFARLAQAMPSREAAATCESLNVLPYSRSEHFRLGVEMGSRWDDVHDAAEAELVREMKLPEEAASISLGVDRVSMAMAEAREKTNEDIAKGVNNPIKVQFRMAYAAVWTLYDPGGKALQAVRYAHVPTGGAAAMERSLKRDLDALLERRPDLQVVTLADGAPELQLLLDRVVGKQETAAKLIDFWHTAEHLGEAIAATGRYVDDLLGDWKIALLERDDAIDDILAVLQEWAAEWEEASESEPLPDGLYEALTYLTNNHERMRYASVHRAGLPIGSGTVEATCKTIVDVRMKRSGCRWVESERGPQAILGLRALATSEPRRWKAAMPHVLSTYRQPVTMLPARIGRAPRTQPTDA